MSVLPPEPNKDGSHWLGYHDEEIVVDWRSYEHAPHGGFWRIAWLGNGNVGPVLAEASGYHYLRPVPTVAQLNAADHAQREADDAIAEMQARIEELEAQIFSARQEAADTHNQIENLNAAHHRNRETEIEDAEARGFRRAREQGR